MRYGILDYSTECEVEREIITEGEIFCYAQNNEDKLPCDIESLDAVMLWHDIYVTEKTIRRLKNCKVIVRVGVGFDNVDCCAAGACGIPVVNIPDYGTNDVADHAWALLLAVARGIVLYDEGIRRDPSANWAPRLGGKLHRLTGAVLGIVGLGRIGTAFALRAKAFGMRPLFYDPYLPDGFDKAINIERVPTKEALFGACEYISIHAPLTGETEHMINEGCIRSARPGLSIVNTARGKIVNLDAVYLGLKEGILRSFVADVLENEPPDLEHPLIRAYAAREEWLSGRMILTPHAAFYAEESRREMREKAALQMLNAVCGKAVRNCVNREFLKNSRTEII